jgi:hypothetical protein
MEDDRRLRLELELPGGALLNLRVADDVKLHKIKRIVEKRTGLTPSQQSLYHGHRALAGDYPLAHYNLTEDEEEGVVPVRVERGLLGGASCCICFIPCPPPCCKKKDDDDDDEDAKASNYYPST